MYVYHVSKNECRQSWQPMDTFTLVTPFAYVGTVSRHCFGQPFEDGLYAIASA